MTTPNTDQNLGSQQDTSGNDNAPEWMLAVNASNHAARLEKERADNLQRQLDEINARNSAPPAPPLEAGDIINNPEVFRQRIADDVKAQVAPLNNAFKELGRKNDYLNAKLMIKNNFPHMAQIISLIEPELDKEYLVDGGPLPTDVNLTASLEKITGRLALQGKLNRPSNPNPPQNNVNNNSNSDFNPPNVRPSVIPPNRNQQNEPDLSQFDENERRLMREKKLTPSEFLRMRDCAPNEINKVWKQILVERAARNGGQ